jgi:hypothetical protein
MPPPKKPAFSVKQSSSPSGPTGYGKEKKAEQIKRSGNIQL